MKKTNLRNLILALLVFTSLASYIYLNTVEINTNQANPEMKAELEEESSDEREMLLPDVQMIKRILEKGRTILHAS